ncbi:MAG TPA: CoA transferase [Caulobacteraceae bacterium]|nr:CoA transferase [Caulobacteraceae bacterium]
MRPALNGLRVLEIGDDVAVRYLGRLFSEMGAEVVRTRPAQTRIGYDGVAGLAYCRWLDERKRVDPEPGGHFDLVSAGLDPDSHDTGTSAQAWQGGVLARIAWFDPEGPYAGWRGADEMISALVGLVYPFGEREGPPVLPQGHIPQIVAGLVTFNAAMAALLTPPGRRPAQVDVNVLEAAMCFSEPSALGATQTGDRTLRLGVNRFVPSYPCSSYPASDGWVGVTCLTPAQWRALCRLLGRPDLAEDPRFATTYERLMLGDEVDAAIASLFSARTQAEWVRLGVEHRIPIAPMTRPGELPRVEHWRDRGAFERFGHGEAVGPSLPWRMTFDGVVAEPWIPKGEGRPLGGLRVADFSMGWAGPLCTRTLADLGADVVKVECKAHPDWWRGWEENLDREILESRIHFIDKNRGKRGVDIDLGSPEGRDKARALIASADVVVENFAAGVFEKLGLGAAVQRALRPGVISLSMPAFGNGGPLSEIRAYGSTVEHASGMPFVNGEAHWAPALQHVALGDPVAGLYGAAAVLAALYARERLGGAYIDLAQVAGLFHLGADAIIGEQAIGGALPRTGSARARLALSTVVDGRPDSGWLAVAARDEDCAALSQLTGGADASALAAWSAERTPEEAAEALQAAGVAAAPVRPAHSLTEEPQLAASGFFAEMDRAVIGPHKESCAPFRFDGQRPPLGRPAPLLGEHTAEVFAELKSAKTTAPPTS